MGGIKNMSLGGILSIVISAVLFLTVLVVGIVLVVRQYKATIARARKIDPTVKTYAEADYVLKKDIAQSISAGTRNNAYCKECGAAIDTDSKFCKKCGKEQ